MPSRACHTHRHAHTHAIAHTCTHARTHAHMHTHSHTQAYMMQLLLLGMWGYIPFVEFEIHWFFCTSSNKVREGILEAPCPTYPYVLISIFTCFWALSRRYLQNYSAFCKQTWYGSAWSWAEVSYKKKEKKKRRFPFITIGQDVISL